MEALAPTLEHLELLCVLCAGDPTNMFRLLQAIPSLHLGEVAGLVPVSAADLSAYIDQIATGLHRRGLWSEFVVGLADLLDERSERVRGLLPPHSERSTHEHLIALAAPYRAGRGSGEGLRTLLCPSRFDREQCFDLLRALQDYQDQFSRASVFADLSPGVHNCRERQLTLTEVVSGAGESELSLAAYPALITSTGPRRKLAIPVPANARGLTLLSELRYLPRGEFAPPVSLRLFFLYSHVYDIVITPTDAKTPKIILPLRFIQGVR